jgi:tRNA (cytidine56-2'-O)-methyltransferase
LGATIFSYSGEKDENLETSLIDVSKRWGGKYKVQYIEKIPSYIKNWGGIKIHSTMYGEPHQKTVETLTEHPDENLLIIVGGAKVPRYIYSLADFNTAIGWQPHSEVSAVAILLYSLVGDQSMYTSYDNAEISLNGKSQKARRSSRFEQD